METNAVPTLWIQVQAGDQIVTTWNVRNLGTNEILIPIGTPVEVVRTRRGRASELWVEVVTAEGVSGSFRPEFLGKWAPLVMA